MWPFIHPFLHSVLASTIIGSVGFAFFLVLTIAAYRGGAHTRRYVPGLVLSTLVALSILIRVVFFPTASAHPATLGGQYRLATGLLAVFGGIMLFREWRKDPRRGQPGTHI